MRRRPAMVVADGAAGRFKLVVFDLDGTLVDTRRDLAQSTNALIGELGGAALDEELIGSMVGHGVAVWLERALALAGITPFPAGALERFIAIYDEGLLNHTRPYDGIPEALAQARGRVPLTVLTNKMRAATVKILEGLDLAQYFSDVGGVDGPYPPKPAPEGLLAMMGRGGAEPAETLLVGDSPVDWHTAKNAGARICVARYGFGYVKAAESAPGDFFIEAPGELAAILS